MQNIPSIHCAGVGFAGTGLSTGNQKDWIQDLSVNSFFVMKRMGNQAARKPMMITEIPVTVMSKGFISTG